MIKLKILTYIETDKIETVSENAHPLKHTDLAVCIGIIYIEEKVYEQLNLERFKTNKSLFEYLDTIFKIDPDFDRRRYALLNVEHCDGRVRGKLPYSFYITSKSEADYIQPLTGITNISTRSSNWRTTAVIHGDMKAAQKLFNLEENINAK